MKAILNKAHWLGRHLLAALPAALPLNADQMRWFIADIFELYGLPDMPSYRQAIASMIMHLPPTQHRASRRFFGVSVKKAMANQLAYEVIEGIRKEEAAERKKAEEKAEKESESTKLKAVSKPNVKATS